MELYMDAGNPNPLYGEEMINNYRNNVDPSYIRMSIGWMPYRKTWLPIRVEI